MALDLDFVEWCRTSSGIGDGGVEAKTSGNCPVMGLLNKSAQFTLLKMRSRVTIAWTSVSGNTDNTMKCVRRP